MSFTSKLFLFESPAQKRFAGMVIMVLFVVASAWINNSVLALQNAGYGYGYYGGAYNYGYNTSDAIPSAPGSVTVSNSTTSSVRVGWTAVTTTTDGTNLDNFGTYVVYYATSAANANSTSGTAWTYVNDATLATQSTTSTIVTGLSADTAYWFSVYAYDTAKDSSGNSSPNPSAQSTVVAMSTGGTGTTTSTGGSGGSSAAILGSVGNNNNNNTGQQLTVVPPTAPAAPGTPGSTQAAPQATLAQMASEAGQIVASSTGESNVAMGVARSASAEAKASTQVQAFLASIGVTSSKISASLVKAAINWIAYGTESTRFLGSGERAGVLRSFMEAYNRFPGSDTVGIASLTTKEMAQSTKDWQDVIKIANGRWPSQRSEKAEARAKDTFKKIYKRAAVLTNARDQGAVIVMAYGLRPAMRRTSSEKAAILSFKAIFKKLPVTAKEWDAVRAIAYSGATKEAPKVVTVASTTKGTCYIDTACKQILSNQQVLKTECKEVDGASWLAGSTCTKL